MKKTLFLTILLSSIIFSQFNAVQAEDNVKKEIDKDISAEIDKKMEDYNKEYKKKLADPNFKEQMVDLELINSLTEEDLKTEEGKEALEKLETVMNKDYTILENKKDQTVQIRDLSPNPPKGTNNISSKYFKNGDIILLHDGWCNYGYWRHSGHYDYATKDFISSSLGKGMLRQSWKKMHSYDEALGICPKSYTNGNYNVKVYARSLLNKKIPYSIKKASKKHNKYMYCSLVAWKAWKSVKNVDLDWDWGPTVISTDLSHTNNVKGTKIINRFAYDD